MNHQSQNCSLRPCAEALCKALPFKVAAVSHVQRGCAKHHYPECPVARELHLLPPLMRFPTKMIPIKQCHLCGPCSRSLHFCILQRIKLPFAFERNLLPFSWQKRHLAGGPLLGPNSKGSVTICVCFVVCNFITYIGLHMHHHSQTAV